MYQFLFKNRWFALAFVVMTLASVSTLVGSDGEETVLSRTKDNIIGQKDGADQAAAILARPDIHQMSGDDADSPTEFATDEELIDNAEGFEPEPEFGEEIADEGEIVMTGPVADEPQVEQEGSNGI